MRDLLLLAAQLIITLAKLARPGGVRSVIAESLLLKQQLLISRRSRRRAPPLTTIDRFVLGFMVLFLRPPTSREARRSSQAGDAVTIPQSVGRSKISLLVLVRGKPPQARPEGTNAGNHRGNRPDEAS
jgi:hypothetical protein